MSHPMHTCISIAFLIELIEHCMLTYLYIYLVESNGHTVYKKKQALNLQEVKFRPICTVSIARLPELHGPLQILQDPWPGKYFT